MVKIKDWMKVALIFLAILGLAIGLQEYSKTQLAGRLQVLDGDSIKLQGQEIRLLGIDAPEYGQTCLTRDGSKYPCGRQSRNYLQNLVRGRDVECTAFGKDRYERLLALCKVGEAEINRDLVLNGWAVSFGDYRWEENEARLAKRGIWSGEFQKPADWRKDKSDAHKTGFLSSIFSW